MSVTRRGFFRKLFGGGVAAVVAMTTIVCNDEDDSPWFRLRNKRRGASRKRRELNGTQDKGATCWPDGTRRRIRLQWTCDADGPEGRPEPVFEFQPPGGQWVDIGRPDNHRLNAP